MNEGFYLSQILAGISFCLLIASYQFKGRKHLIALSFGASVLLSIHYFILSYATAGFLVILSALRFATALFTTSPKALFGFVVASVIFTIFTYSGFLSALALVASITQTVGAFQSNDRRLRQLMITGVIIWLVHNIIAGTPVAALSAVFVLISGCVGYFRFYLLPSSAKVLPIVHNRVT